MTKTVFAAVGGEYSDYRVYAIFENREAAEAFIKRHDSADDIEERTLYDKVPRRIRWHAIERMRNRDTDREWTGLVWEFEGQPFVGYGPDKAKYLKWEYGKRAFGTDKAAVEALWEVHHADPE